MAEKKNPHGQTSVTHILRSNGPDLFTVQCVDCGVIHTGSDRGVAHDVMRLHPGNPSPPVTPVEEEAGVEEPA
jgi:hypothetical protein